MFKARLPGFRIHFGLGVDLLERPDNHHSSTHPVLSMERREQVLMRRILRRRDVEQLVGLGRSSIYAMMEDGTFPQSVKLGPRAVGWVEEEIELWIEERIADRDRE